MRLRSKAREVALHILYRIDLTKESYKEAFSNYKEYEVVPQEVAEFAGILLDGVSNNLPKIDSLIKQYVQNWEIERLAVIDRNVMRLSCFELLFLEEIPPKVAINEGIELAKRFGDVDSPRFVNGVLDKIYKMECNKKDDDNFQSKV